MTMTTTYGRPLWAEVSRTRLAANFGHLRQAVRLQGGAQADVLAVVKADAYGHGAGLCAPVLAAAGARWLGVTSVEEGVLVRTACSTAEHQTRVPPPPILAPRILVMCGLWQGEAGTAVTHSLTPVVWEMFHLDALEQEARRRGLRPSSLAVHLEIDTGMARQGVAPGPLLERMVSRFDRDSRLRLEGVLTHFASPEMVDSSRSGAQMASFRRALATVAEHGLRPEWIHAGNSSTVDAGVEFAEVAYLAGAAEARPMARPGLALYGYSLPLVRIGERDGGSWPTQVRDSLQPVLAWKTRIVSMREAGAGSTVGYGGTFVAKRATRLALLPVGYADGLRRELSSRQAPGAETPGRGLSDSEAKASGEVLIRGQRAPIAGRVSMDLTVVDVSAIPEAAIGDEAVLIGEQGADRITAEDHARLAGTIPYEILCGISNRVPRVAL